MDQSPNSRVLHCHTNTDGDASENRGRIGEQECCKWVKRRGKNSRGGGKKKGENVVGLGNNVRGRKNVFVTCPQLFHDTQ